MPILILLHDSNMFSAYADTEFAFPTVAIQVSNPCFLKPTVPTFLETTSKEAKYFTHKQ